MVNEDVEWYCVIGMSDGSGDNNGYDDSDDEED